LASANISEALPRFKIYSLRSSIIVSNGLYKTIFTTVNNKRIATNGKVALKSNSPPGPLITELEISIED
jgi:hypothetical protein